MQNHSLTWLKRMVIKSASSPDARIVNLFTILQDWLDAPGVREQLLLTPFHSQQELHELIDALVSDTKLPSPDKLATQLFFILLGALNEEIRNPGGNAITSAGEAACSLIHAAKPSRFGIAHGYAIASTVLLVFILGAFIYPASKISEHTTPVVAPLAFHASSAIHAATTPDQLALIYQMHNRLQSGQCAYPQALMLAENQRAAFLEGVVNIDELNTATINLDEVRQLYQKVDCYYPPQAMLL